jgi:phosphate-selective porin OprO/OprP
MKQVCLAAWVVVCVVCAACFVLRAGAEEKPVVDEILDILRRNKQISDEEYGELQKRAQEENPSTFRAYWKDGLRFETKDKKFVLKIGGRIQNDWALMEGSSLEDDFGLSPTVSGVPTNRTSGLDDIETGTEFRRARLEMSGTIYQSVEFKSQFDFAGAEVAFKDVYLGLLNLPVLQHVRVGHFKEPFSLEELTSSKYITFMERGLPNVFAPSRNTGLGVLQNYAEDRVWWGLGAFREADDSGDGFGGDSLYNVTTRLTGLPWYEADDGNLLHVGLSYSHQFRNDDSLRYRQRPEAHLSPVRFNDTSLTRLVFDADGNSMVQVSDIDTDGVDLLNPEVALVFGPFSIQAEYMHSFVNASSGSNPDFYGVYAFASYFITGEHRSYKVQEAAFDRIKPKQNFFDGEGGAGAWEVALRYSRLDLEDAGVRGGKSDDITLGVNWYLNPNVRVMFNYVWADLENHGDANIVQCRFQIEL